MWPFTSNMEQTIRETVERVIKSELNGTRKKIEAIWSVADLSRKTLEMRGEIETLKIEKMRKEEEFEKREREITHKIGLERMRQEFERDQAKREAEVEVKKGNLDEERKRFEDHISDHRKAIEDHVEYMRDLTKAVLERVPSAEIFAEMGGNNGANRIPAKAE